LNGTNVVVNVSCKSHYEEASELWFFLMHVLEVRKW